MLTVLAVAGTAIASIFYIQEFAKIDPLLNMRKAAGNPNDPEGITLGDVKLVHYRGNKRVTEATVDKVFITKDRSTYRMEGVSHGAYIDEKGKRHNFSAPNAVWNSRGRILNATGDVRVWNKDMDIKTALFRVNEKDQILYVPGKVKGRFFGGNIVATNLRYDVPEEVATFGPVHWKGLLAVDLQDGGKPQRKPWDIEMVGGGTGRMKEGKWHFPNAYARDADEVIIRADLIVHDDKADILTATGNVRYFSKEANMVCGKAVIYRKEKRAVLTENVDVLVKPKDKHSQPPKIEEIPPFRPIVPQAISAERPGAPPVQNPRNEQLDDDLQNTKTIRQYPTAITAQKVEYWYGKGNRHGIFTGSPQARQDLPEGRWRHVWAKEARYNGETEFLTLLGTPGKQDVQIQTSIGDDIICENAKLSTKEGVDDMEAANPKARLYARPDDDGGVGPKPPDPLKTKAGGGGLSGKIGGAPRNRR